MTELDDIRAFVEVINQGGFSQAARRLGLAKSIVSRRISRLEADLGARLLNFLVADSLRDGRSIELLSAFALPDVGLYLVRPPSAYVPAKVRELITLMIAHFGGVPPWVLPQHAPTP